MTTIEFKDIQTLQEDYYTCLGLRSDASSSKIRKAYLLKLMATHPDKQNQFNEVNTSCHKFLQVQEAYNVLIDVEQRKIYDEMLSKEKYLQTRVFTTNPISVKTKKSEKIEKSKSSNYKIEKNVGDLQSERIHTSLYKGLVIGPNGRNETHMKAKNHLMSTLGGLKANENPTVNGYKIGSSLGKFGLIIGPSRC